MATPRRFRPTDAFVDESVRGQRYLMACILAQAHDLPDLRMAMKSLAAHERVHFNNESAARKHRVLGAIAEMPLSGVVAIAERRHGVSEFVARNMCLSAVVVAVQKREVQRLVIESRDDDREDERHLIRARQPAPQLVFEHRRANTEPMLWVADALAWACGAGVAWRRRIDPVLAEVIELGP